MASSKVGQAPYTGLLLGISATTATAAVVDFDVAYDNFTVVATSGTSTSAGTLAVSLSNDGVNFWTPASNTIAFTSATTKALSFTGVPARFVKVACSVNFSGGVLTSASVAAA